MFWEHYRESKGNTAKEGDMNVSDTSGIDMDIPDDISFDTDISRYRLTVSNPPVSGCSATPFQLLDKNISLFASAVKHLKKTFSFSVAVALHVTH